MRKKLFKDLHAGILILMIFATLVGCSKSEKQEGEDTPTPTTDVQVTQMPTQVPEKEEAAYPMQLGTVEIKQELIYEEDFENEQTDMKGRGAAKVTIDDSQFYEGVHSLLVTGRTAIWNGATVDLTKSLTIGENYQIEAYVRYENGPDTIRFDCKLEKNNSEYLNVASNIVKKGEWTLLKGSMILPEGTSTASVYIETAIGSEGSEYFDFYVDGVKLMREEVAADRGELPALKEVYQNHYSMGVAATVYEISPERKVLIEEQFNSFTPGNELKPDSLLDYAACISDPRYEENPQVNLSKAEPLFRCCQEKGIAMRGHVLVWHSQTPRWFFTEGYSKEEDAPFVSKERMLRRLENYIKNVLEQVQTKYPGMIYAWDVVNEAINPGDGEKGGYRSKDSLWYQVIGPQFVEKSFEYARKYSDPEIKLFYNDYNTEEPARMLAIYDLVAGLKEKGLIDGIGLQTHITTEAPSLIDIENSIRKYGELGLDLQITELDMGMEEKTEESYLHQATRYKRLFTMFKHLDETGAADITNITFWGLSDDVSWLSKPGIPSYPLLFDQYLIQKPAFWGVILSKDIPLY
jgi:endo-1,4-beta-xylanase